MIFRIITTNEVQAFFSESYGYATNQDAYGNYIYPSQNNGFIILKRRSVYWAPLLYLNLLMQRKSLNWRLRIEWHRFMFHTMVNREIRKQSKSK